MVSIPSSIHDNHKRGPVEDFLFLFGEPGFIRSLDPDRTVKKLFRIVDEHLELAKRLKQKQVAKEYAEHDNNAMSCDRTLLSIRRLLKWRVNEICVFYYLFLKTKDLENAQR